VHSGSLPFLRRLDGLNLVGLVDLFVALLPEAVRYGTLWESSFHPAAAGHGSHQIVLDGLDKLSFFTLLAEAVRYGHSANLPFLRRCLYLSIQPPPDTVPTG
jgi:hypothetical protein